MKNKYKLFNKINMDDNNYKVYKLSNTEKENIYNKLATDINNKKRISKNSGKRVAIASVLCILISTFILSNEKVWAIVENIGRQIELYIGKEENELKGYKVAVNQIVEDKDIKLTLYEAIFDDGQILLSMNMDHSNFDESTLKKGIYKHINYYTNKFTVYIDDKKFVQGGAGVVYENEVNNKQDFLEMIRLDSIDTNDDNMADIENYKILDNIETDKYYNIKVVYEQIGIQQVGLLPGAKYGDFTDIDGKWEFEFEINGKEIMGDTQVFDINKDVEIEDKDFKAYVHIDQLRISPISTKLIYTVKMGEEYLFNDRYIDIELQDQDGNLIAEGSSSGGGNKDGTLMNMVLEEYQSDLEKTINIDKLKCIKIIPYQYYKKGKTNNEKIKYEDKSITVDLK
ncbi:MAG: DUF4179 domain-containing protein [Terrisporobacter sp.]